MAALSLIKLCVGCDSVQDLDDWIREKRRRTRGKSTEHIHTTRMLPKRADELTDGGSLYWVIRVSFRRDKRTVISHLLTPLRDQLMRTLREKG
jgi:hypothetical protein